MSSRKRIYLDYAATTPLDPRVGKAMKPFFAREYGNPSSIHAEGVAAKKALDAARTTVARCLEAHPDEIVFTSGGTEANNLAIFGAATAVANTYGRRYLPRNVKPPHIVTTNIEHSSVLEPLRELERRGAAEVSYVPVESDGIVGAEKVIAAIRPNTVLVSVMYANNEIGTIQPIRKIGQLLSAVKGQRSKVKSSDEKLYPIFHVDACQSPLYLRCLVNALGVDLLTLDGHKVHGPKGVGALFARRSTPLVSQLFGGGQERWFRSTTENVPAIVGFAEALRIATAERETESNRIKKLRDNLYFLIRANKKIDKVMLVNGSMDAKERLPSNLNISLPGVDTEMLTLQLDAVGIACSTKSSCLKNERESYVVRALGGTSNRGDSVVRASSTIRFTLGRGTRRKDVIYVAEVLTRLLKRGI